MGTARDYCRIADSAVPGASVVILVVCVGGVVDRIWALVHSLLTDVLPLTLFVMESRLNRRCARRKGEVDEDNRFPDATISGKNFAPPAVIAGLGKE